METDYIKFVKNNEDAIEEINSIAICGITYKKENYLDNIYKFHRKWYKIWKDSIKDE